MSDLDDSVVGLKKELMQVCVSIGVSRAHCKQFTKYKHGQIGNRVMGGFITEQFSRYIYFVTAILLQNVFTLIIIFKLFRKYQVSEHESMFPWLNQTKPSPYRQTKP